MRFPQGAGRRAPKETDMGSKQSPYAELVGVLVGLLAIALVCAASVSVGAGWLPWWLLLVLFLAVTGVVARGIQQVERRHRG